MNRPALDRLAVVVLGETGDDGQLVSERLERLQDWGELEAAALSGGRPVLDHHAVREVHDPQPDSRLRRGPAQSCQCRDHSVQKRQGYRHADTAQNGAARNCLLRGYVHDGRYLLVITLSSLPLLDDDWLSAVRKAPAS